MTSPVRTLQNPSAWMLPFLKKKKCVVLDGGMGTTLAEQGANVASAYWSANCFIDPQSPVKPQMVYDLHYNFLKHGADVIITNTYKISQLLFDNIPPELKKSNVRADAIIGMAVDLAVQARNDFVQQEMGVNQDRARPLVCAAFGPYGTAIPFSGAEYIGNYGVGLDDLEEFWRDRIQVPLQSADVDLIGFETIPDYLETVAICNMLNKVKPNKPCWISWTCKDDEFIHSGYKLVDCVKVANACPYIDTIGVNCLAPQFVLDAVNRIRSVSSKPIVVYPNSGRVWDARQHVRAWTGEKTEFDSMTDSWIDAGVSVVGGCCDCNEHHISKIWVASNQKPRAKL